ncbi:NAD(P)-dependent oxidoreductase [Nonomuraea sp. NN258]|uniref:NAD(P)-dependent oxidoreductase n=1 Tax=Nonomuraea antri TaxID=2730852 RepID=UPI0015685E1E|nr:NAD(P)-dependent oxidoreductase [Nonomuraea antri]NRQ39773.1 NAD(P)-dependent oxidoreductase [Nonomuraea antri]
MRVGIAGLGNMGGGMCRRLADSGFETVAFDLDPGVTRAAGRHPGVTGVTDVRDLAAPVVVTMLPDGAAVRNVVTGLLAHLAPGSLVVDCSSADPAGTVELARLTAAHGVDLMDSPVSGSPAQARDGTLTLMAAGSAESFAKARPVLAALGRAHHVGPLGSGHALKALNNLLSSINLAAAAEILLAGQAYGLKPAAMLQVINISAGRSHATETKLPDHVLPRTFDSGFALRLMAKDLEIAASIVAAGGGAARFTPVCREIWRRALAASGDDAGDNTEVVRWLERQAGRELTLEP